jgi:O-methyltransferase
LGSSGSVRGDRGNPVPYREHRPVWGSREHRPLPEGIDPDDALARETLLSDINMMVASAGGRERTEADYRALLVKAGLRLTRVIHTPGTSAIIEAEPG